MNFILERMKAWMAALIPAVATAAIKATEQSLGFDIPIEWEVMVIGFLTGLVVHQVPNKTA